MATPLFWVMAQHDVTHGSQILCLRKTVQREAFRYAGGPALDIQVRLGYNTVSHVRTQSVRG